MFSKFSKTLAAFGLLAGIVSASHAAPLAPGQFAATTGKDFLNNPEVSGSVVASQVLPFKIQDATGVTYIQGNLLDMVIRSNNTGTLHFYSKVLNATTSASVVSLITRSDFTGFATDADYRSEQAGALPGAVARTGVTGDVITFFFGNTPASQAVKPGQESRWLLVETNATSYRLGFTTLTAVDAFGKARYVTLTTYGPTRRF